MLVSEIVALAIHCRLAVRDFPNDPSIIEIGELQAGFLQLLCDLILKRFKHLCFWLDLHIIYITAGMQIDCGDEKNM